MYGHDGNSLSPTLPILPFTGAGVQCIIAKSFAFIYPHSQPNGGLLGITIIDEEFHSLAQHGVDISVDLASSTFSYGGKDFAFHLSEIQKQLIAAGGITEASDKFGKRLFNVMCGARSYRRTPTAGGRTKDIELL